MGTLHGSQRTHAFNARLGLSARRLLNAPGNVKRARHQRIVEPPLRLTRQSTRMMAQCLEKVLLPADGGLYLNAFCVSSSLRMNFAQTFQPSGLTTRRGRYSFRCLWEILGNLFLPESAASLLKWIFPFRISPPPLSLSKRTGPLAEQCHNAGRGSTTAPKSKRTSIRESQLSNDLCNLYICA